LNTKGKKNKMSVAEKLSTARSAASSPFHLVNDVSVTALVKYLPLIHT
jgi:hypothetical protein